MKAPRVRDLRSDEDDPIRFTSKILPPYLRKTKSLEELIPWLYLKGISTGDFTESLSALLGKDAPGLSPSTISRLKEGWKDELLTWRKRSLANKRYVYFLVDGVYLPVRMESEQSWEEVLLGLKSRGLKIGPKVSVGHLDFGKHCGRCIPSRAFSVAGFTKRPTF